MNIALIASVCTLGLIGAAAQAADALATQPDTQTQSRMCLDPGYIDHLSYPDDNTILFYMRGTKVKIWRNDLPRTCNGMKFQSGIAWEIHGGEICANAQVFYVINRWAPCRLGSFTPYTPPPKPAETGGHQ